MSGRPGSGPPSGLVQLAAVILAGAAQAERDRTLVILDRIRPGSPAYCVHGETFCAFCHHAVWLGPRTYEAVVEGAIPLCLDCVPRVVPPGHPSARRLDDQEHP